MLQYMRLKNKQKYLNVVFRWPRLMSKCVYVNVFNFNDAKSYSICYHFVCIFMEMLVFSFSLSLSHSFVKQNSIALKERWRILIKWIPFLKSICENGKSVFFNLKMFRTWIDEFRIVILASRRLCDFFFSNNPIGTDAFEYIGKRVFRWLQSCF